MVPRVRRAAIAAAVLISCGGSARAFAATDARILALELSGELLPPPGLVAGIEADLLAIGQFDPYLAGIHVLPSWAPGRLSVGLTDEAWQLFLAGQYHGLDSLDAQYGPAQVEPSPYGDLLLTFPLPYHPVLLAGFYANADGVQWAEPDHVFGDGDDIVATASGSYTFQHGWGDCSAGCFAYHYWDLTVTGGVVHLDAERGAAFGACCLPDDTCVGAIQLECEEQPWIGLGGTFVGGSCTTNPCGTTAVGESVDRVGWGRLKSRYR